MKFFLNYANRAKSAYIFALKFASISHRTKCRAYIKATEPVPTTVLCHLSSSIHHHRHSRFQTRNIGIVTVFAAKPAPWCEAGALLRRQLIRRQLGVQRRRGRRITRTPSLCLTPLIELRKRRWSWIEVPVRQVTGVVAHFLEKPLFDCILVLLDFMRKLPSKAELHCIYSITSPCVTICFLTLLLLTFVRLQSVTDLCSYSWGTRRLACRSHRSEYTPLGKPHSAPLLTLYSPLLPSVYNWPYCGTSFGSVTL